MVALYAALRHLEASLAVVLRACEDGRTRSVCRSLLMQLTASSSAEVAAAPAATAPAATSTPPAANEKKTEEEEEDWAVTALNGNTLGILSSGQILDVGQLDD